MSQVTLSDVEWINLNMLAVIHAGLRDDRASTCGKFALDAALADSLKGFSLDELLSLVFHVGDTTLFPPRADLMILLNTPRPLVGPLALAHPSKPVKLCRKG